jgi:hypothetical protein
VVVDAYLTALRAGDFEGLLTVLDPDFVVRADAAAGVPGAPREIRGAQNWARGVTSYLLIKKFSDLSNILKTLMRCQSAPSQ